MQRGAKVEQVNGIVPSLTPPPQTIKLPKVKDKGRILQVAREKETVAYKGVPIRLSADFSN